MTLSLGAFSNTSENLGRKSTRISSTPWLLWTWFPFGQTSSKTWPVSFLSSGDVDLPGFNPNLNSFYQTHFSDCHWHRNKYCPNQGHTSCLISFRAFLTLNNWTQGSTNVEPHYITAVREASNTPCLSQLKIDGTQSPAGPTETETLVAVRRF